MKRWLVLAMLIALVGCSSGPQVTVLKQNDLPPELFGEARQQQTEARAVLAVLYFVATDASGLNLDEPARLVRFEHEVTSTRPEVEEVARLVLSRPRELIPGEKTARVGTAIPLGTQLLSVSVKDRLADVNLSAQFESADADVIQLLRVAQVVYTLTELPNVDAVRFRIHGAPQAVVDQQGVAHEIVSRSRYSQFEPTDPSGGEVGDSQVGAD